MVVAARAARQATRSGVVWGYAFGAMVAASAVSYGRIYKTVADRERLALAFGANHAASALFGPAPQLQTVAGFTVYKVSMTLMIIGAVWGLLTSTRLLRGDEDAGRWELLLSGRVTRGGAAAQVLLGLGAGLVALWAVTAAVIAVAGRSSSVRFGVGASLYFALALVAAAGMFLAIGAFTSQLAPTRRRAAGFAGTVLGLAYGLRMVADAGAGLHWLVWVSPLGWVEELRPLTGVRPAALVPIVATVVACGAAAVVLAGRRDLGASLVRDHDRARPRLGLLGGPGGLAVRLERPVVAWWAAAIAVTGLLMGVVAKSAGATVSGSSVEKVLARLGSSGTGATAYLGVASLILAVLVAFAGAGQIAAARAEEAEGRLDHLLVRPVGRRSWLLQRLALAVGVVTAGGLVGGLATWVGTATQHTGVSFGALLEAGINVVPPAVLVIGAGTAALGLWPRRTAAAAYGVLVWSVLVDFVGAIVPQSHWVLDTSVFHHMASAPAVSPHWEANAVMVGLGLFAMALGTATTARRDVAPA
jgi:ABC-2 type transport system permease protein